MITLHHLIEQHTVCPDIPTPSVIGLSTKDQSPSHHSGGCPTRTATHKSVQSLADSPPPHAHTHTHPLGLAKTPEQCEYPTGKQSLAKLLFLVVFLPVLRLVLTA